MTILRIMTDHDHHSPAPAPVAPAPAPAAPEPAAGGSYVRDPRTGDLERVEGPEVDTPEE